MRRLAQSTAYTVMLKLFLSSDHVSAATGKTVAITISKAGGAFGNPNAGASNATEVSNGWYKFALDTTDTATLGDLVVRGTSASCDDAEQVCQVVSATTGGATNLDAAVSAVKTKTDSLTFTVAGMVDSNVVDWKGATAPAMTGDAYARIGSAGAGLTALGDTRIANLDVATSTRSTYAGADTAGTTTLLSRLSAARAGYLDNLSAGAVATAASIVALPQAVWDVLTSALTTVGSIGKLIVDGGGGTAPTANQNADALLDRTDGIEAGLTPRQAMRLMAAEAAGKLSGAATSTNTIRNAVADSKNRIVATVDTDGNRTAITYDLT